MPNYGYMGYPLIGGIFDSAALMNFMLYVIPINMTTYQDVDKISFAERTLQIPANIPDEDEILEAKKIVELENNRKTDELPYRGMMLTTMIAKSHRVLRLAGAPHSFDMSFGSVFIGNVALLAIPGEPFSGVGISLKKTEGWNLVFPLCLTNGFEGYFPMQEAYDEGGYETAASNFRAGVAEYIIRELSLLLQEINEQ